MFSKGLNALLLVLFVSAATFGSVYAAEDTPQPGFRARGRIVSVSSERNIFTIETRNNETMTVNVVEETRFRSRNGSIQTINNLEVDMLVAVAGSRNEDGDLVAGLILAGHEGDLQGWSRILGTISDIYLDSSSFTLIKKNGETQRFLVTERTRFRSRDGSIQELADLESGMSVLVGAVESNENQGGSLEVILIAIANPNEQSARERVGGEIESVDAGRNLFTLITRQGTEQAIIATDQTRFISRDGSISGVNDLEKGMYTVVIGTRSEDGDLLALRVAIADQGVLQWAKKINLHASGQVITVGIDSVTIEDTNGEQFIFLVDEETVFRSRSGDVKGLDDLKSGMKVLVGGQRLDEGHIKAIFIGVGRANAETTYLAEPEVEFGY